MTPKFQIGDLVRFTHHGRRSASSKIVYKVTHQSGPRIGLVTISIPKRGTYLKVGQAPMGLYEQDHFTKFEAPK